MVALSASHKPRRRFNQRLQHGLQIERRAADDLQHIGGGRLLLQRFAQILGAGLHFVEQADIFDGDDGLVGEVLDQLDLARAERLYLGAAKRSNTPITSLSYNIGTQSRLRAPAKTTILRSSGGAGIGRCTFMDMRNLMRPERSGKRGVQMRTDRQILPQSLELLRHAVTASRDRN